jgi:pimeloyl-ACP methyl ester carboxylesterase
MRDVMTLPVIFIPGHLCTRWIYEDQIAAMPDRQITVADTFHDDTCGGMADRLLASAPDRFVLAGLSMGGMVAMEVIARAPDRVAGACLMDTDPTAARDREIEWRRGLLAGGMEAYVDAFVGRFYLHDADTAARLVPLTRRRMLETPEDVARAQVNALDTRREMAPLISGFSGPVSLVVGADDKVCPPFLHHRLAESLRDAEVSEIPDCGHIATVEEPDAVSGALQSLVGRAERGER